MPNCAKKLFKYPAFDRRKIEASCTRGDVSSDGGVMLQRFMTLFIINKVKWKIASKNNDADFLLITPVVIKSGLINFAFFSQALLIFLWKLFGALAFMVPSLLMLK